MIGAELFSGPEGQPLVRVTLDAAEVGRIAMWLQRAAENHTQNGIDMYQCGEKPGDRWQEAQGDSHRESGAWWGLDMVMSDVFWRWANDDIPCPWPTHPDFAAPDGDA